MAGQQADVILAVLIHTSAFRNHITDILVVFFQTSFLIGNVGITVKHSGSKCSGLVTFDVPRILKFGPVVSKDDWKILLKCSDSKRIAEVVDGIDNATLGAVGKQNQYHKGATAKQQCKQAFPFIPTPFDGIHFHHIKFREGLCIILEVDIGPFVAVNLRDVPGSRFRPFPALFVADATREVYVSRSKDSPVQIVIKSSSAYGYFIAMDGKYVA